MLEDFSYGIDVGACGGLFLCWLQLFRSRILVGAPHGVGIGVGITETQVDEFHIVSDTCDEDVRRLEVEMYHLVGM